MIKQINKEGAGETPFKLREVLVLCVQRMKTHVSNEKGGYIDDDRTLVGYLTLIYDLLSLYIPLVSYEEVIAFEEEHSLVFEMFY